MPKIKPQRLQRMSQIYNIHAWLQWFPVLCSNIFSVHPDKLRSLFYAVTKMFTQNIFLHPNAIDATVYCTIEFYATFTHLSLKNYYTLMLQHFTYLICDILFINFYGSLLYQKIISDEVVNGFYCEQENLLSTYWDSLLWNSSQEKKKETGGTHIRR